MFLGDAAGVDALTGEGISLGFQQQKPQSRPCENRPKNYRRDHRVLVRRPFLFTQIRVWASSRPWLAAASSTAFPKTLCF